MMYFFKYYSVWRGTDNVIYVWKGINLFGNVLICLYIDVGFGTESYCELLIGFSDHKYLQSIYCHFWMSQKKR